MNLPRAIQNTSPVLILFVFLMVGVALCLGSTVAHVQVATFPSPNKQLGYFNEINWSLNYVLFVPLAIYFFASSFNGVRSVIRNLADSKMIVDTHGNPLSEALLQSDWEKTLSPFLVAGLFLGSIGMIASWVEWWRNFNYPEAPLAEVLSTTGLSIGWNLAPLAHMPPQHLIAAKVFGLAAYTMQGAFAASYLCFLCVIFGFATWVYNFTTDRTSCELLPDLMSSDRRMGYENFEPLIETLMFAALSCFGLFFLTRLDHAFIQSSVVSLGKFVQTDIWEGFIHGVKGLAKANADLFNVGDLGYSIEMVGIGLVLTIVMAFFIPTVILRQAAHESQQRALHIYANDPGKLEKLNEMMFWPMLYPTPIQLLGFLFLAAMCFVFFKLTLILIGAAIAICISKLAKLT